MPTVAELLAEVTKDEIKQLLLDLLEGKDFPIDDWNDGGVERTLIEAEAWTIEDLYKLVPLICGAGFLEEEACAGPWLTIHAKSQYGTDRTLSVFAVDTCRLTCAAGSGPVNITAGQLWATDATGLLFNNTEAGVLADGGTLDLKFKAESPGSTYNLTRGAINKLVTPLPGVTITNIEGGLVTTGADEESDAKLKQRCRTRWATLGGATAATYENWALTANEAVTRVRVKDNHPRGQGTVDVVIAGDAVLGGDVVTAVTDYIAERKPITDDVAIVAAAEKNVAPTGTGKVKAGFKAQAELEIAQALAGLAKGHSLGGTLYTAQIVEDVMGATGMVDLQLTNPATPETTFTETEFLTITVDFVAGLVLTEV